MTGRLSDMQTALFDDRRSAPQRYVDLYLLGRITDHPHVDFGSLSSPDGRRVVFVRSQFAWVSFREAAGWDVYVVDVEGRGERRVAPGGSRTASAALLRGLLGCGRE